MFSIAEAGQLSYEFALNLTLNLKEESEYTPWYVAYSKLTRVLRYLQGSSSSQETAFKVNIITKSELLNTLRVCFSIKFN